MKRYQILVVYLLVFGSVNAQEVISTQGDSYMNVNGSIDFTIGETIIATGTDGFNDITQGFHQTNWNFVGIEDHDLSYQATIYPNPTEDVLNIKAPVFNNVQYIMYDVSGKIVMKNILRAEVTSLEVTGLASGQYSIVLYDQNETKIKLFKLIKLQ